ETPSDPAPLDMIETMVNFRPRESWPRRKLLPRDARAQTAAVLDALEQRRLLRRPRDPKARDNLIEAATQAVLPRFDVQIREYAYQRNQEWNRSQSIDPATLALDGRDAERRARWAEHVRTLDGELICRAAELYTRLALEELIRRGDVTDSGISAYLAELDRLRGKAEPLGHRHGPG